MQHRADDHAHGGHEHGHDHAHVAHAEHAHHGAAAAAPSPAVTAGTRIEWTCPMHPEIVRYAPGNCPICGMALEPRTATLEDVG
ncbi:MAG TPA: heavy metal-binding domain-containing protein, partial [Burkholderiales bacterium]|nr:heavy metal-binding domain-containing protein [Burkholderiales bacterium]